MIYEVCKPNCSKKEKLHQCRICHFYDCDEPKVTMEGPNDNVSLPEDNGTITFCTPTMNVHLECLVEMIEKILDKQ